ncbi:MAG: hypothetical protein U9R32_11145 [Bacteroidota bacterium]|nr:hypothetical protein [Bacteroidota bacterium]
MTNTNARIESLITKVANYVGRNSELEEDAGFVESEQAKLTDMLDRLRNELRESSKRNVELEEFISDYKEQIQDMESRINKMDEQYKAKKETIKNLMTENLDLKKQIAELK